MNADELARLRGSLEAAAAIEHLDRSGTYFLFVVEPLAGRAVPDTGVSREDMHRHLLLWLAGRPGASRVPAHAAAALREVRGSASAQARLALADRLADLIVEQLDALLGPGWYAADSEHSTCCAYGEGWSLCGPRGQLHLELTLDD